MNNKYDNSKLLDVHKWSDYLEVNNAVNHIYGELKRIQGCKGNVELQKRHLRVIILDLWATWLEDKTKYIAYHRGKNQYKGNSRYNKLHISFKTVSIVDSLEKLGYVENKNGFFDEKRKRSRIARMKTTPKLIRLIEKKHECMPEMIKTHPDKECIILRDKNKNEIEYQDTIRTKSMRNDLLEYNQLLAKTFIDIPSYPKEGVWSKSEKRRINIDHTNKFVRRIFNNGSWEDGGRFYSGWWQNIPRDWREKIRINNCATCEIDYSGLHIVILYALEGIDYWKDIKNDPYQIEGYEKLERMRGFLKQVLLTIINSENEKKACKSIRDQISRKRKDKFGWVKESLGWNDYCDKNIKSLLDDFIKPHEKIRKYFFSGYGVKLQNIDSLMAEYVIRELTLMDIPVLCIHDSFIVQSSENEELDFQMKQGARWILEKVKGRHLPDFEPRLKMKGIGLKDYYKKLKLLNPGYTRSDVQKKVLECRG